MRSKETSEVEREQRGQTPVRAKESSELKVEQRGQKRAARSKEREKAENSRRSHTDESTVSKAWKLFSKSNDLMKKTKYHGCLTHDEVQEVLAPNF